MHFTAGVGEDVEQLEGSDTTGEKIKWHTYLGKQFGDFSLS